MTDVIFLPGAITPAEVGYRPLLDRLPGVNALLKDLEIYATDRPAPDYSVDDEIRGIDAVADQAGLRQFTSTGTQQALPAHWHTRPPTPSGCCPLP